jgi:ArsR family transcriptional regulator
MIAVARGQPIHKVAHHPVDFVGPPTLLAVKSHAFHVTEGQDLSEQHAISALAALAQPTRLAIFRLLVKHEPVGITAGVIAETIGARHNTLSTQLAFLVRAGLLRSCRDGRSIIYRSGVAAMKAVISFLIDDCCNGHPELFGIRDATCDCEPASKRPHARRRSPASNGSS